MRRRSSHSIVASATAVLLFASTAAGAAIINGGFETGNFSGWTQFGDTSFTGVVDVSGTTPGNPSPVESGTFAASFGPATPGGIFQSVTTTPGTTYTVLFGLQAERDVLGVATPNSFAFSWAGTPRLSLVNSPAFAYHDFSFNLLATAATTDLRFTFTNAPAFWDLDNVSVTAAVPEPATLALLGLGALAAVFNRRRQS